MQVQIPCVYFHVHSIEFQHSNFLANVCLFKKNLNFWLVVWWNFAKNCLPMSSFCLQYEKFSNIDSFRILKIPIFLILSFIPIMLRVSDDTICETWGVICIIKFFINQYLFTFQVRLYTFSSNKSQWTVFPLNLFEILDDQCGFSFLPFWYTLVVIEPLLQDILVSRNFSGFILQCRDGSFY